MATLFSKILSGEIPSHAIAGDENFYAFLDINPLAKGHTLVIPRQETDYIYDLDDEMLAGIHVFSKRVAKAIEKVVPCKRIGIAVLGLEVPHAHIHLIPINNIEDINFARPKLQLSDDELAEIASKIRQELKV